MKPIGRDLMLPGIYCIICITTSKRYVGSSVNIYQRLLSHRAYLRHNTHENRKLQNSWNKHGEETFDYYILEFCDKDLLKEREQHFMNVLSPEFNNDLIVSGRVDRSEESIKKQSETRKQRMAEGLIKTNCAKTIYQYDLGGNFIMEHPSIKKAAAYNNIHGSSIERNLYGIQKKGGGYLWSYDYVDQMPPYIKYKTPSNSLDKKVLLLDCLTSEILEFSRIKDCALFLGKSHGMVRWHFKKQTKINDRYMVNSITT